MQLKLLRTSLSSLLAEREALMTKRKGPTPVRIRARTSEIGPR